ncbi:RNA polymerase subunit sigma-70 [Streptomyces sp. AJS327]|nr:sigma factor [Streptomyces sp. AJS327]MBA0053267.1 RNA polymerase subunit sigma-70 [Streptomyces sp. AJS327]
MANDASPRWDRKMQQRLERGEAAALGELYDRFAPLVHGLAHRVLDDEAAADRTTREVFGYVWEHPARYDPRRGPMRSWIADLTQRQATASLRDRHRNAGPYSPEQAATVEEKVRAASTAARADYIVTSMPAPLRAALELAYFQRRDCRQTAANLGVTEDEARRRLRLGLQLLASAVSRPFGPSAPAEAPGPSGAPTPPGRTAPAPRSPAVPPSAAVPPSYGGGAPPGPAASGPLGRDAPGPLR